MLAIYEPGLFVTSWLWAARVVGSTSFLLQSQLVNNRNFRCGPVWRHSYHRACPDGPHVSKPCNDYQTLGTELCCQGLSGIHRGPIYIHPWNAWSGCKGLHNSWQFAVICKWCSPAFSLVLLIQFRTFRNAGALSRHMCLASISLPEAISGGQFHWKLPFCSIADLFLCIWTGGEYGVLSPAFLSKDTGASGAAGTVILLEPSWAAEELGFRWNGTNEICRPAANCRTIGLQTPRLPDVLSWIAWQANQTDTQTRPFSLVRIWG